jgi:signal transduction histidine kinase
MLNEHIRDNRGLLISLVLLIFATVAAAAFLMYSLLTIHHYIDAGQRDVASVLEIQDLQTQLQTAESNERGFIITGDKHYLRPYRTAVKKIPPDLEELQQDPQLEGYSSRLQEVVSLTHQKLNYMQQSIQLLHNQGFPAAQQSVESHANIELTHQIVQLTQGLINSEFRSLVPAQSASTTRLRDSLVLTPALVFFVLATTLLIVRYGQRAVLKERAIEGSKNEFLSLASHQLRTPATNVKQYIGLVLDGYFGELNKEQKEALEVALTNNDSEISIINDLLNIAKADLNQISLVRRSTDMTKLVNGVVKSYRNTAKERQQKLRYTALTPLREVDVDPTYFRMIVENLVDNASKYTPEGGRIDVEASQTARRYVLTVRDNGVGMRKPDQAKLFKKFSRVPNELSDVVGGSGLGLYWVKRLVELHSGRIGATSRPGKGSTFTLTVPLGHEEHEHRSG